jgi:hypothetical protein
MVVSRHYIGIVLVGFAVVAFDCGRLVSWELLAQCETIESFSLSLANGHFCSFHLVLVQQIGSDSNANKSSIVASA